MIQSFSVGAGRGQTRRTQTTTPISSRLSGGPNERKLINTARGANVTIDDKEYGWEPIFSSGKDRFYCSEHAPESMEELSSEQVVGLIDRWLNCDKEAEARRSNFTSFPVAAPYCSHEGCEISLVWANRRAYTA